MTFIDEKMQAFDERFTKVNHTITAKEIKDFFRSALEEAYERGGNGLTLSTENVEKISKTAVSLNRQDLREKIEKMKSDTNSLTVYNQGRIQALDDVLSLIKGKI